MIQTDYCPDKFGTYLSHPESQGGGIDLSDASVREIILAYRAYRRTRYAIVPKLTYSLLKKYGYRSPYTSSVSNYDRYLHSLLREIGEEFNDTVITEVKVGGVVSRNEKMLRSQICQDIRTVHFL